MTKLATRFIMPVLIRNVYIVDLESRNKIAKNY